MTTGRLVIDALVFLLAVWTGAYLLARNPSKPRLRYAGLGLIAYAMGLAAGTFGSAAPDEIATRLYRLQQVLILLPALLWTGTMIHLLAEESALRKRLAALWEYGWLPGMLLLYLIGATTDLAFGAENGRIGFFYSALAGLTLTPLAGGLLMIVIKAREWEVQRATGVIVVCTIFFGLQVGWFVMPLFDIPAHLIALGIGFDLGLLGVAIAVLDAFEEGELLRPDMIRSAIGTGLVAFLLGGQVALVTALSTGVTLPMVMLLLSILAAAVFIEVFASSFETVLDRVMFGGDSVLGRERLAYRQAISVLPRINRGANVDGLDDREFVRLTRRALSHFGDLTRLASNPLAQVSIVGERLASQNVEDSTLARARELKTLLAESIERLKPEGDASFGTTDEWRLYNALYFPYVLGLKPYSRRSFQEATDPVEQEAIQWFQTTVPERTLYNWQNAAARLVAQDLREQMTGQTQLER